jgi:transposase
MEIDDGGFDHSVISKFRDRLIAFEADQMLMDKILDFARESGLVKPSRQRTDATSILSAARLLNRCELIHEHIRLCLDDLTELAPAWLNRVRKPDWSERYSLRPFNYKLGKTDKVRNEFAKILGADAVYLLEKIVEQPEEELKQLDSVLALYQIFEDYFDIDGRGLKLRKKLKPSGDRKGSPHDTDARVGAKRGESWLGYKKHLTETVSDDGPNLITNVLVSKHTSMIHLFWTKFISP